MAKKQIIKSDIIEEKPQITEPITFPKPDEIITDFISNDEHLVNLPQTILTVNLEDQFSQQDYLEQVAYYSEELLVSLEGIFIGGHAAQIKDQLYIALNNYKNI